MNGTMKSPAFWRDRLKASAIHLSVSLLIAALAAALVFGVWYPYPYREISGGRELFWLVVGVDVVMGPLITLAVFNRRKPSGELKRDLVIVALLQLGALAYGLWTVSIARPVHLVFEVDRFRVVHAVDVPTDLLQKAPSGLNALPLTGPTLLATRPFRDSQEAAGATTAALQGLQLGFQPELWQPYAHAKAEILKEAKPASQLKTRFANRASEIDRVIQNAGGNPQTMLYLPLIGRNHFWTVFLDSETTKIVATMPLDPF